MIFKSDLIEAINGLSHDLLALTIRVSELENKVSKLEKKTTAPKPKECKLEKEISKVKSTKAKKQPRTKDGKFAKKK